MTPRRRRSQATLHTELEDPEPVADAEAETEQDGDEERLEPEDADEEARLDNPLEEKTEDATPQPTVPQPIHDDATDKNLTKGAGEEEKLTKEQEIWEGMREEFHPVLEQLPLSLLRVFSLMRELDAQGANYLADIVPRLEEYVKLRKAMAEEPPQAPQIAASASGSSMEAVVSAEPPQTEAKVDVQEDGQEEEEPSTPKTPPRQLRRVSSRSRSPMKRSRLSRTASSFKANSDSTNPPPPPRPKTPPTARSILSSVGTLLEDAIHASQEKVNLAQAAYDSADRYVRLLDQAILEQETALSIGIRPGTHPALLPEVSVPRWQRNAHTMYSPLPGDEVDSPVEESNVALAQLEAIRGATDEPAPSRSTARKKRGKKKDGDASEKPVTPNPTTSASAPRLKLKVPPLAAVVRANNEANDSMVPVDPNEPTYCYCNSVSYGDMVGCDNEDCPYEWFHLACVGLTEVPKSTKWYCKDCREAMGFGPARKRKR